MDAGNQHDDQALTPESNETGWGAPVGSNPEPEPVRRRPVVRSAGPSRWERPGWDRDPAEWIPAGPDHDEAGGAAPAESGEDPSRTEGSPASAGSSEPDGAPAASGADGVPEASGADLSADGLPASPDDTAIMQPIDPRPADSNYGADPMYAPVDDYEETGLADLSEPVGTPQVWGANSFEVGRAYQRRGFREPDPGSARGSFLEPPIFPSDPYLAPAPPPPRHHGGVLIAAAVGVLVLVGGGVAALATLGGPHGSEATTSNSPSSPSASTSAHARTPATKAPTTPAPATTAPATTNPVAPGTTIFGAGPSTTSPTTPPGSSATVALSTWTTQELHLILQMKSDLTNLNRDLDAQPNFALLSVDATNLRQDLASAMSSPAPANATVASEWTQLLRDMGTSNNDLARAIQARDPNLAQDLAAPVTVTDTDYNALSHTLDEQARHADAGPRANGQGNDSQS